MIKQKNKSGKRTAFLEKVMGALKHEDIYGTINYKTMNEDKIKMFIYPYLLKELTEYLGSEGYGKKSHEMAKQMLLWEGNKKTTKNNFMIFGVQHRPDMLIENGINVAIEIKKGNNGASIREGIGQSIVYSSIYDFVIYLFVDTSKDKRILNSIVSDRESNLIQKLWQENNILFGVI